MTVTIDIAVEATEWNELASAETIVRRAIEAVLKNALIDNGEVGVVLCDDAHMQELNQRWRGKDQPTNVLSFPASASGQGPVRHFGDVVLAYETLNREADAESKSVETHLSHLAVHGMLHLLGSDHENDGDAEAMENLERKILAGLGIPDPYAGGERMKREHA